MLFFSVSRRDTSFGSLGGRSAEWSFVLQMVSVAFFLSRVLHLLSSGLLLGVTVYPFLYVGNEAKTPHARWVSPVCAVLSLCTGVFNAIVLRPKQKMGDKVGPWRMAVYGLKTSLLVACTPLLVRDVVHVFCCFLFSTVSLFVPVRFKKV